MLKVILIDLKIRWTIFLDFRNLGLSIYLNLNHFIYTTQHVSQHPCIWYSIRLFKHEFALSWIYVVTFMSHWENGICFSLRKCRRNASDIYLMQTTHSFKVGVSSVRRTLKPVDLINSLAHGDAGYGCNLNASLSNITQLLLTRAFLSNAIRWIIQGCCVIWEIRPKVILN